MKETSKGNDNIIEDSLEQSNDESEINNNNIPKFNYVNNYTPFNFSFSQNVREINKDLKKYFGFVYYENTNQNESIEKNDKNNNNNENIIKENRNEKNNRNDIITNNSYNSNNILNTYNPNLDNLINIVKEDDENEYIEEASSVGDYSDDDFGFGITFTIRPDSCLKIVIVNIVNTYNKIDPNYKYQVKYIEEEEEEENNNMILTNPSEPVKNNGLDNKNNDLIVSKDDEIKNEKKKLTYIVKDLLGTGVSGQTFKVFCPNTNNYYALKVIKNKDIIAKLSLFEIKTLELLNKKDPDDKNHIIRFYDYFLYNKHLCIAMELLQKTLLQLLEMNNSKGISLGSIRYICRQILQAVEYMHNLKIVHTDLKPENILLSVYKDDNSVSNKSNLNISNINNQKNNINQNTNSINNLSITSRINKRVQIKIADFGTACPLNKLEQPLYIQSLFYRAPEVIIGMGKRTEKIDVWSIGCILGELYLGTPIMPGISGYDQLNKINVLIGECPQYMIENCSKRDKFFIKDNINDYYRIKKPEEYYKEYPKEPKSEYQIPKNMKSIDDLINAKDTIKSKNSLHKSLCGSSFSQNSSITREDAAAFIHLMKGMLQIDPNKRLSCKQCLKHPFLTKEKLDKLILFEDNEINQVLSNSFNSNNSFNFNNNCHSMNMNNSYNKFQTNKGQMINKNKTFYGGYMNSANKNNFSFGNFNCNNNMNFHYPPFFPSNPNQNFIQYNYNNNNNINNNNNAFQGNMNYNNKKMNSSFSFNNNYNYMNLYPNANMFNFDPNKRIPHGHPENFIQYPNNNIYYNIQNNFNNFPNFMSHNNNPYMKRHNNTFIASSFEKLNTSYNSNVSKNSKNNKQQQFHKNKKNINPNEFLFNKENIILGNLEDNKQETKNKENTNTNYQTNQAINQEKNNIVNTQSTSMNDDKNKKDSSKSREEDKNKDENESEKRK